MLAPKTRIEHATFTYADERNAARTVHGYGFRPVCECGHPFRVLGSYSLARGAIRDHLSSVHRADVREAVSAIGSAEAS